MEYQRHHGNPWNINVEIREKFHGIRPTCYRGISMESHGTPYKLHWFSMEIPWRISVRDPAAGRRLSWPEHTSCSRLLAEDRLRFTYSLSLTKFLVLPELF